MPLAYHVLDVFTATPLAGNPLAVVLDADHLTSTQMQSIAREFNLSETVFVLEPRNPINTARLRIFTPGRELPFAGHPTVGSACLLAHLRAPALLRAEDLRVVLEEEIGEVVCIARHRAGQALAASFTLPRLPERLGEAPSRTLLAEKMGVPLDAIGFAGHVPSIFSAGVPFLFVPLADPKILAGLDPRRARWGGEDGPALYAYCVEKGDRAYGARMFASGLGIDEDPATGSAAAAFSGLVAAFERPGDGEHFMTIAQGLAMGRPSTINLEVEIEHGRLISATIGGSSVIVAQGTFHA